MPNSNTNAGIPTNIVTINQSNSLVRAPVIVNQNNISVAAANTTVPNVPTYTFDTGAASANPMQLMSLSLSFSSTFQTDYSYMIDIDGVPIFATGNSGNSFQLPDVTASTIEYCPHGKTLILPKGAKIRIWAYNSGGASSAGTFSIFMLFDTVIG